MPPEAQVISSCHATPISHSLQQWHASSVSRGLIHCCLIRIRRCQPHLNWLCNRCSPLLTRHELGSHPASDAASLCHWCQSETDRLVAHPSEGPGASFYGCGVRRRRSQPWLTYPERWTATAVATAKAAAGCRMSVPAERCPSASWQPCRTTSRVCWQ